MTATGTPDVAIHSAVRSTSIGASVQDGRHSLGRKERSKGTPKQILNKALINLNKMNKNQFGVGERQESVQY